MKEPFYDDDSVLETKFISFFHNNLVGDFCERFFAKGTIGRQGLISMKKRLTFPHPKWWTRLISMHNPYSKISEITSKMWSVVLSMSIFNNKINRQHP